MHFKEAFYHWAIFQPSQLFILIQGFTKLSKFYLHLLCSPRKPWTYKPHASASQVTMSTSFSHHKKKKFLSPIIICIHFDFTLDFSDSNNFYHFQIKGSTRIYVKCFLSIVNAINFILVCGYEKYACYLSTSIWKVITQNICFLILFLQNNSILCIWIIND